MLRAILHSFESTVEKIFICTKLRGGFAVGFFSILFLVSLEMFSYHNNTS